MVLKKNFFTTKWLVTSGDNNVETTKNNKIEEKIKIVKE